MDQMVGVAVVDNQPLFRQGIGYIFQTEPHLRLVGEGVSSEDAIKLALEKQPHLMLLGLHVPGRAIDAVKRILNRCSKTQIVIMSSSGREEDVSAALDAGARGYFLKSESGQALIQAVRCVAKGESYVTPSLAARLFQHIKQRKKVTAIRPELTTLTRRETEILYCVGLGLSNKAIAKKLRISDKTVKHYMTNILHKLQVQNRVQAALIAQKAPPDNAVIEAVN